MASNKKHPLLIAAVITGIICVLSIQLIWIYYTYHLEHARIMEELDKAFSLAYQKEQTYRIPVVDIVNPGDITIQSCKDEEILIIRKCPDADTIVYNNASGRSIDKFLNRVFQDLRANIVPMNIHCLSDLYAGLLYDKDIPVIFVIERYDIRTGVVLETSLFPDDQPMPVSCENVISLEISDNEAIRAVVGITPFVIFRSMVEIFIGSILFTFISICCFICLYKRGGERDEKKQVVYDTGQIQDSAITIGKYVFNPFKNELQGFGETIQLNKKENSILYTLYMNKGNVVERSTLLNENWGSSGVVYSRSLDTYLAALRKYLKKDSNVQIVTVKGLGYKLVCEELNN